MSGEPALPPPADQDFGPDSPRRPDGVGGQIVERFMAMVSSGGMSPRDQFLDKLTSEQLDKVLDQSGTDQKNAHDVQMAGMWMGLGIILGFFVLIGFLVYEFLSFEKGELLREIIALLIGLSGGGVGGFGLGRLTKRLPPS